MSHDANLEATPEDFKHYAHINANAPTRITISTFLASVCLTMFVVFLPSAITINGFDLGPGLVLFAEMFLGIASVFFLIVSVALSIILTRFGHFSFDVRKSLSEGSDTILDKETKYTLEKAAGLYVHAVGVMYWGLLAVMISLVLLGFHVHVIIGVAIVIAILVVVGRLFMFLKFALGFPIHMF